MAKLFGFVQFHFAGRLPLADGRYLASSGDGKVQDEWVLVLKTIGAPPAIGRRRRLGRPVAADPEPAPLNLTQATAVRASVPHAELAEAARWLEQSCEAEETIEVLVAEALAPLNRALHALAVASADPSGRQLTPEQAERVLIGYGSGEETADGRFTDAREVELTPGSSRRRRREQELQPQERVAAVLRGRERLDACETLLLRARADLDAGREREAALQLRIGLETLLTELDGAVDDPGHERDMATLREHQAGEGASIEEMLAIAERVLRRRRVLNR